MGAGGKAVSQGSEVWAEAERRAGIREPTCSPHGPPSVMTHQTQGSLLMSWKDGMDQEDPSREQAAYFNWTIRGAFSKEILFKGKSRV